MAELLKQPIITEAVLQHDDGTLEPKTVTVGYRYEILFTPEERANITGHDRDLANRALFAAGMDIGIDRSAHAPEVARAIEADVDIEAIRRGLYIPQASIIRGMEFGRKLLDASEWAPENYSFDAWLRDALS